MTIRLNKLIAYRGLAARRKADELIQGGQVKVNGVLVREPGTMVEEESDRVTVKGKPLPPAQRARWFMLHKPVGVISTVFDPEGRRTVRDLLPTGARVFPVGRLDADTSGLLLLTNDGPLAHHLMHPRYGVEKIYRVRLAEPAQSHHLRRLAQGVRFDEGLVSAPAQVRAIDPGFDAHMIEIRIHEGRFRQVRRMCEAVGLEVTGLHRVGYGPLRLGPLPRGEFRELFSDEVALLRSSSARPKPRPAGVRGGRGGRAKDEAKRREIYMHGADAEPLRDEPSHEGERRDPRTARGERPARAVGPSRDVRRPDAEGARLAARGRRSPPPVPDDEVEERWGPGAGAERESFDAEWPARPSGRRGDADFEGGERPARATRPAKPARPVRREDRAPRADRPTRSERPARGRPSGAPRGGRPGSAPRTRRSEEAPARSRRRSPASCWPGAANSSLSRARP